MSTLLTNLISYWKLDEASGNAVDSAGSNTGVNTGVTYGAGKINNCGDWGTATNSRNLKYSGGTADTNWSINAWAYVEGGGLIHSQSESGSFLYKALYIIGTQIGVDWSIGASNYSLIHSTTISVGWHMATVTYNESTLTFSLYLNGTFVTSGTSLSTPSTRTGDTVIGSFAHNLTANQGFKGKSDEIGSWDKALTASEVTELYNGGAGLSYPFTSTANTGAFFAFF